MDTESIREEVAYLLGMIDQEINFAPDLDARNILEEEEFKEFLRNRSEYNSRLTDRLFELSLSVVYYHWLQHD